MGVGLVRPRPEGPRHQRLPDRRRSSIRRSPARTTTSVTRAATCAPARSRPPCPITAIDQRFINLGRGQDPGPRRGRCVHKSPATAYGPLRALAQRHVLHPVRRAAAGRHVRGLRLEWVPGRCNRHHAALEAATHRLTWTDGPWIGDPRQHATRPRTSTCRRIRTATCAASAA